MRAQLLQTNKPTNYTRGRPRTPRVTNGLLYTLAAARPRVTNQSTTIPVETTCMDHCYSPYLHHIIALLSAQVGITSKYLHRK